MTRSATGSYLRTSQVAAILGNVSPKTITRWVKEGKLPHTKTLGGHARFPEVEIRKLLQDNTIPAE
jgi:excisionase family DNA binding protein